MLKLIKMEGSRLRSTGGGCCGSGKWVPRNGSGQKRVGKEPRRGVIVGWGRNQSLSLGQLQSSRHLLLPLRAPVLEPGLYLNLGEVEDFGQFQTLRYRKIFVRLKEYKRQ